MYLGVWDAVGCHVCDNWWGDRGCAGGVPAWEMVFLVVWSGRAVVITSGVTGVAKTTCPGFAGVGGASETVSGMVSFRI